MTTKPAPMSGETPRTDVFADSCATYVALKFDKQEGHKARIDQIEFCLALDHARTLERDLSALHAELGSTQWELREAIKQGLAAESALAAEWGRVIEECAKVCELTQRKHTDDTGGCATGPDCARAIRALKEKP